MISHKLGPYMFMPAKDEKWDHVLLAISDLRNIWAMASCVGFAQHQHLDGPATPYLLMISSTKTLPFHILYFKKAILKGGPFIHISLKVLLICSFWLMYCHVDLTKKFPLDSSIPLGLSSSPEWPRGPILSNICLATSFGNNSVINCSFHELSFTKSLKHWYFSSYSMFPYILVYKSPVVQLSNHKWEFPLFVCHKIWCSTKSLLIASSFTPVSLLI